MQRLDPYLNTGRSVMAQERNIVIKAPWFKVGCILGEGPLYDPSTSLLHFVDISEKKVFHLNTQTLDLSVEEFAVPISCLALRGSGDGLACTTAEGFALLDGNSTIVYLCQPLTPQEVPFTRFNDGACDSQGRFFAGTICNPEKDLSGKLYRYDPITNACDIVDEGPFTDSNGLGWSPDEKTFYFTDSLVNKIYAYDYQDGNLRNRRLFVNAIEKGFAEKSYCDGLCIDEEGGIWSARWGGSCIVRFDRDGNVDFQIDIPTALNVTSCCFGGSNNDQMYITTAHCSANGGDKSKQEKYPDSGHIFLADLSGLFRGLERFRFAA